MRKPIVTINTDVGCVREVNEDSYWYKLPPDDRMLSTKGYLVIVCDGMGGHAAGEVASGMAVNIISEQFYQGADFGSQALKRAIETANSAIFNEQVKDTTKAGMGTTCTALVLQNGYGYIGHVGDSRLYLIRNNDIYQQSEDHSMVFDLVKRGHITKEEARVHPNKNVILRALGTRPEVEVAVWPEPINIREGDIFLLCSDGLYDLVEDKEILNIALSNEANQATLELIALAKKRGGHDNITVAIIETAPRTINGGSDVPVTRELRVQE